MRISTSKFCFLLLTTLALSLALGACQNTNFVLTPTIANQNPDSHIVVGGTALKAFPHRLLGVNLSWEEESLHLSTPDGSINPTVQDRFAQMGSTVVRYPGGTLADIFDADNGALALANRAKIWELLGSNGPPRTLIFGIPEMLAFRANVGAELVYTANVWSENDPSKAARTAQFLLNSSNGPRADQLWIELGNEPYLLTTIPGYPADSLSATTWATRAMAYRNAIRAVNSHIRFIVPLRLESINGIPITTKPGFTASALPLIKDSSGLPQFDAVAVHDAYMPVVTDLNTSDKDMILGLAAGSRALSEVLDSYTSLLQSQFGRTIPLALTEWHPILKQSLLALSASGTSYTQEQAIAAFSADQRVNGQMGLIYTTDVLSMLAYRDDIALSTIFAGTGNYIFGVLDNNGQMRSPGLALKILKEFVGSSLVAFNIQSPKISTPNLSLVRAMDDLPVLSGLAALKNGKVQILLINRDPDSVHTMTLDLSATQGTNPSNWTTTLYYANELLKVGDYNGIHTPTVQTGIWHPGQSISLPPASIILISP